MFFHKVGNSDKKVLLHWSEEHHVWRKQSIILMYKLQPLKYELEEPETYKSTEYWTIGKFDIKIYLKDFLLNFLLKDFL